MDKTEKAFLKQPKVFRSNVSGKGKRPGKEGHPFSKPAGLGFKSPGEATEGTDNLAGTSHSAKMNRIIIARRNYLQFIKKYMKRNISAHVSPCFRVKEGEL